MKRRKDAERREARGGFTLIEVLLVVAILGILATVVVVNFGGQQEGAKIRATRASIKAICTAVDLYEVEMGRYPGDLQDLTRSTEEHGAYIRGGVPTDAWGNTFQYTLKDRGNYVVKSAGPDGQMGSDDDITSFITQ